MNDFEVKKFAFYDRVLNSLQAAPIKLHLELEFKSAELMLFFLI